MSEQKAVVNIREARKEDREFVVQLMVVALAPYYGGDHKAHAERIFSTHIAGGIDNIGHFSVEQKMFILALDDVPAGMIHLVGKRQGTYKISPIIVAKQHRGRRGLGSVLLRHAEEYAERQSARQMYCTVAEQNNGALQFFLRKGYIAAGKSDSHYKPGVTEVMLYKLFTDPEFEDEFDRPNISVLPCEEHHVEQVRKLLLGMLPEYFGGIDESWVDALFAGYGRRQSRDVNLKFKLIFVAEDRKDNVLGVAGATPKKGEPIKVMPFIATTLPAFVALLTDIPYALNSYGRKTYIHIVPTVEETIALQQRGWKLDAAMPGGYHDNHITQQWSLNIEEDLMRVMRVKKPYLDLIRNGEKTLEVRVGYNNIKKIQAGERIKLASRTDEQIIRVNDVRQYKTFDEMLQSEEAERIAPGLTENEVLALLKRLYPPKRENLGVFVLDIESERDGKG